MSENAQRLDRDRPLDPRRAALLVVDAQEGICRAATGSFARDMMGTAVPNLSRLLGAARACGMEVVFTVIQSLTRDGRDRSLDYKITGFHFPPGSRDAGVIGELAPGEYEIVLPKTSSSVFNSTSLDYVLRNIGIEAVIVGGFQTDQCIDHTVRDGADRGYEMICAADACAAQTPERHRQALGLFGGYCRIAETSALIGEMEDGADNG